VHVHAQSSSYALEAQAFPIEPETIHFTKAKTPPPIKALETRKSKFITIPNAAEETPI
jgi:hypothetical protein